MTQQVSPKRRGRGKTSLWSASPRDWMNKDGIVFQSQLGTPEERVRALEEFRIGYLDIRKPLLTHFLPDESSLYAIVSKDAAVRLRNQTRHDREALQVCTTAPIDPTKHPDMQWLTHNPTRLPLADFNRALICSAEHQHNLYLHRAADTTVLYVGKSDKHPGKRPLEHFRPDELFGVHFMVNFDVASSWTGEVLTLEECEQPVLEMLDLPGDDEFIKAARLEHYRTNRSWAIGIAEWVLIWLLRPCWNGAANPFPAAPPTDLYRLIKANGQTNLIAPAAK